MRAVFQKTGGQEVRIVGWDKQSVPTNHYKLYKNQSVGWNGYVPPLLQKERAGVRSNRQFLSYKGRGRS